MLAANFGLKADGFLPVEMSPYVGFGLFSNAQTKVGMLQTGFKYTPSLTPLFVSADNNLHVWSRKYEWEGKGTYHFRKTINNFGVSAGFNFFRKTPFCVMLGVRFDASIYAGKVTKGSTDIKNSVPQYQVNNNTFSPFIYVSYRVTEDFSAYFNYHFMAESNSELNQISAFGIAYNIYKSYP